MDKLEHAGEAPPKVSSRAEIEITYSATVPAAEPAPAPATMPLFVADVPGSEDLIADVSVMDAIGRQEQEQHVPEGRQLAHELGSHLERGQLSSTVHDLATGVASMAAKAEHKLEDALHRTEHTLAGPIHKAGEKLEQLAEGMSSHLPHLHPSRTQPEEAHHASPPHLLPRRDEDEVVFVLKLPSPPPSAAGPAPEASEPAHTTAELTGKVEEEETLEPIEEAMLLGVVDPPDDLGFEEDLHRDVSSLSLEQQFAASATEEGTVVGELIALRLPAQTEEEEGKESTYRMGAEHKQPLREKQLKHSADIQQKLPTEPTHGQDTRKVDEPVLLFP